MVALKARFQSMNAQYVARASAGELARLERGLPRVLILAVLPRLMPRMFQPSATRVLGGEPLSGTMQLNLVRAGFGRPDPFTVAFDSDGCTVTRGWASRPDACVDIGLADMVRLGSGAVDPGKFLADGISAGSISLTGDPFLMLAFPNLFGLANRKLI